MQKLSVYPRYSKLYSWGKLITITGSAQAIVQLLGLIAGILIIRLLPAQEYALYTLANAMLGTMTILADAGIGAGVMAQGGKVWNQKMQLGIVVTTGMHMRRYFGIVGLIIATPILLFLLNKHGATCTNAILIFIALIPAFYAALSDTLLEVAPKLRQDIVPLQKNQIAANIGRLILQGLSLCYLPFTAIALLGNGIPRIYANYQLRKISADYADWDQKPDKQVELEILKTVKRILPGTVYYCISGQLTIWLISFFGTTQAVAQLGALGRLSMLLSVLTVIFNTLVAPRYAKIANNYFLLRRRFLQVLGGMFSVLFLIMSLVYLFPSAILWILGKQYSNLGLEFILSMLGSCIGLLTGAMFSLNSYRGWIIHPYISIPLNITFILAGILMFDVSTLKGILLLNIFTSLLQFTMQCSFSLLKIMSVRKNSTEII